jgi:hypothetical protein
VDNEIPVQNNNGRKREASERIVDPGLQLPWDDDNNWPHRQGPRAFVVIESTKFVAAKIVQYLKGRNSRILQDEYSQRKKRYWGQHLWGRGYFCATTGVISQETIKEYIESRMESSDDITIGGELKSQS